MTCIPKSTQLSTQTRLFAAESGDLGELSVQLEFGTNPNVSWWQVFWDGMGWDGMVLCEMVIVIVNYVIWGFTEME